MRSGGSTFSDAKQMVVVTDHDWKVLARKDFPLPRLGSGCRVRLGCRACRGGRLLWGDGGVRADRAPVAGAGPARRVSLDAVRVCATDVVLVGTTVGGPDL